ncbi:MAG: enoyl-CoA hydratase-related protein [Gemmatimonadota bacterium]|nr:enoyl-CoA hydratase-related protein [Gemmatimonadota bacterium]
MSASSSGSRAGAPGPRVKSSRDGGIVTVTLDHPGKMNVLDQAGWEALGEVFEGLAGDDSVRCVIVEGAGAAAFSAGSDISGFAAHRSTPEQVTRYAAALRRGIEGVWDCPHPTVAAVRGLCVGGGLIIAACCDVRVCGESSRFGAPVNRLGATMAYEEMAPLLAAAGAGAVLEILLTGDLVDARRAREMGIVSRIVPDGAVGEGAGEIARRIAAGAPLVNRWHKKFVRRAGEGRPLTEAERGEAYEAFRTGDYREGIAAFMEKRAPRFEGE